MIAVINGRRSGQFQEFLRCPLLVAQPEKKASMRIARAGHRKRWFPWDLGGSEASPSAECSPSCDMQWRFKIRSLVEAQPCVGQLTSGSRWTPVDSTPHPTPIFTSPLPFTNVLCVGYS